MIPDYESIVHIRRRQRRVRLAAAGSLIKITMVISLLVLVFFVTKETVKEHHSAEQGKRREAQREAELRYGLNKR